MKKFNLPLIFCIFSFSLFTSLCKGQYDTILNVNGSNSPQGTNPDGILTPSPDNKFLYGTTTLGGTNNVGCVFTVDIVGNNYKDLLDFAGVNGSEPVGSHLVISRNRLYGMTNIGGLSNDGCIFSINIDGSGYRKLLDFSGPNGANPTGDLILIGGKLFGIAEQGGTTGDGCVFSIDTGGNGYKDLLDFNGSNGILAFGTLTAALSGTVLYGVAELGALHGDGCVFSIDTNGSGYKHLLDFDGSNGSSPEGELLLSGDLLYGMTYGGGASSDGVLYSIDTSGNKYKQLIAFNATTGSNPEAPVILSGSKLYGVTRTGGAHGDGVIFTIDTNGSGDSILHNFNSVNGSEPYGGVIVLGNVLYGTTNSGGINSDGVVYTFKDLAIRNTTGVDNVNTTSGSINVYPNPGDGIFNLEIKGNGQEMAEIQVYNMLGEKVYSNSCTMNNSPFTIDLYSHPNGVYLYRVVKNDGELIGGGKLIIQK